MISKRLPLIALLGLVLVGSGCGGEDEEAAGDKAPAGAPAAESAEGKNPPDPGSTEQSPAPEEAGRGEDDKASWSRRATDGCQKNADQYAQGARSGGGDAAELQEYENKVKALCEEVGEAVSTGDNERLQAVSKEICLAATKPFVKGESAWKESVAQCERAYKTP